eukprot:TRINITY_DN242208_c0_g2_i1.p2 TRINITY_DN242208_c0_g2~~TRINITY_DN242208_c0_g2_i1.p2  ORF type:complete len:321 (-),score=75.59 TRINITY_DN242208_c0_g2_i1:83-1045(-)
MPLSREKKTQYFETMTALLEQYNKVLVVSIDNVTSKQMQAIRIALRNKAVVLMGKNSMMRCCIQQFVQEHPGHMIGSLTQCLKKNIGLVFVGDETDVTEVKDVILAEKSPAPARVGAIAPSDVFVEPGQTGCDPGQTGFFQALNIPTKIVKGQIEMVSRVHLIEQGTKVSDNAAALLQKLNMCPFSYAVKMLTVYDNGNMYDAAVLDISQDDLARFFCNGVAEIAALCLTIGYPTLASLPHSLNNAMKDLIAIAVETEYTFKQAEPIKAYLADPSAFAVAAAPAAASGEAAAVESETEEEEESEEGGMGGLFGDSDESDY